MLHRDISLSNVFVKHYEDVDVVKIGDFGLVKIPESNLNKDNTYAKRTMLLQKLFLKTVTSLTEKKESFVE